MTNDTKVIQGLETLKGLELIKALKNTLEVNLPIMENREKGTIVENVVYTVTDWGYMPGTDEQTGEDKEYACVICKEDDKNFYFLNTVATNRLKEIDALGEAVVNEVKKVGLPVKFATKMSKNKFKYQTVEIIL